MAAMRGDEDVKEVVCEVVMRCGQGGSVPNEEEPHVIAVVEGQEGT